MAVSKAHIKASNKYNKENYKKIQANIKPDVYNVINNYCNSTGISKAMLITAACLYIINNNIDISNITTGTDTK
ncbi:MAG: hypothetical protein K2K57_14205 [Oscillospiraceae bacterium]|nr:hypothetical protein [Oscillospiraceae bacterium]